MNENTTLVSGRVNDVGWVECDGLLHTPQVMPWEEAVDGAGLLDELAGLLKRYVVLPKWAAETLALWVAHTYAFELRDVSTYIGVESPEKRCGKTTLLGVLSELVNRPVVAANISSPAFFRVIEETRPTLLIDEADTFMRGDDELRGILNAGYSRKTAYVVRVGNLREAQGSGVGRVEEKGTGGGSRLARFSCWCPKILAAIGRLPETLADRCIIMRMQRKSRLEQCERLHDLDATRLRRRCARFVYDHRESIRSARPEIPASLHDRAADIWEPLLVLVDLAGGEWPKKARDAASGLSGQSPNNDPTVLLLMELARLFGASKEEGIFSRDLVACLNADRDRPWAEGMKREEVTECWLSWRLRPYGVRPRNLFLKGKRAKGYIRSEILEVCKRYVPEGALGQCVGEQPASDEWSVISDQLSVISDE